MPSRRVISVCICALLLPVTAITVPTAANAQSRGAVQDTRPLHTFVDNTPFDLSDATWFAYDTRDSFGRDISATATLFRATRPWDSTSERPVVIITPFTQGGDDPCAFSHTVTQGTHIDPTNPGESAVASQYYAIHSMLEQGWDVVVPDHPGLGTPDQHSYMDNVASGQALLDAATAGLSLLDRPHAPIALTGHSQGAGASAWAAENAPHYAPKLNIKAAALSAPPYNLPHLAQDVDGKQEVGMLFMAVNTLSRQYPAVQAEIDRVFTPEGKALLAKADTMCVPAMFAVIGKHNTRDLTTTGESVFDLVNRLPDVQKEIQRQRIGLRAPQVPVLMIYHQSDPLVSWEDSRALGENWQREGGTVRFVDYPRNPVADILKSAHSETALTPVPDIVAFFKQEFH